MKLFCWVSNISVLICVLQSVYAQADMEKSASAKRVQDTSSRASKTIQVDKVNPIFSIELKANPTTGYGWFLGQYNHELVQPVKKKYYPAKKNHSDLVGVGGEERWTFKLKPGAFIVPTVITIEMISARPWDVEGTSRTKVFKISAQP